MMSRETSASSVMRRTPFILPSAATLSAAWTSSTVTSRRSSAVMSVTEPSSTGTRNAIPSMRPSSSGITSAVALVAPVVVGMIDSAAALPRRRLRVGRSISDWLLV